MTHTGALSSATEPKPPAPHLQSWEKSSTHGANSWPKPCQVSFSIPNQAVPADLPARYGAPPEFANLIPTCALGRVGDAVALIRGAQVPFVLRTVEGPLSSEGSAASGASGTVVLTVSHSISLGIFYQEMSLDVKKPRRPLLDGIAGSVYAEISLIAG
jgi:hypothetical protein